LGLGQAESSEGQAGQAQVGKMEKQFFGKKIHINSGVLRVARGGYGALLAARPEKMKC